MSADNQSYDSFADFYPFYLQQHSDITCRRLHVIGSALVTLAAVYILSTGNWWMLWILPVIGYGFAWVGHFFFEHNKPATFTYPWYSLMGDWVMFKDVLTRKIKW